MLRPFSRMLRPFSRMLRPLTYLANNAARRA